MPIIFKIYDDNDDDVDFSTDTNDKELLTDDGEDDEDVVMVTRWRPKRTNEEKGTAILERNAKSLDKVFLQ